MLGAGKWAEYAHIPGWIRDPRAEIVVLADVVPERAESLKQHFDLERCRLRRVKKSVQQRFPNGR